MSNNRTLKQHPYITVIVTCYNKAPWIRQCVSAVLSQTLKPLEIILIDDASTDGSKDVVRSVGEDNPGIVRTVFHEVNKGIASTWKEAVSLARGDWIARCDGDDYWISPSKLEKQVAALAEAPQGADLWCNTDFNMVDVNDAILQESCFSNGSIPLANTFEKMLSSMGFTNASTWLVDASFMRAATKAIAADATDDTFDMQLWMLLRTNLVTVCEPLAAYRLANSSDSHSADPGRTRKRMQGLAQTQLSYLIESTDSRSPYPARKIDYSELSRLLVKETTALQVATIDLNAQLSDKKASLDMQLAQNHELDMRLAILEKKVADLRNKLSASQAELDSVYHSRRWKLASRIASLIGR